MSDMDSYDYEDKGLKDQDEVDPFQDLADDSAEENQVEPEVKREKKRLKKHKDRKKNKKKREYGYDDQQEQQFQQEYGRNNQYFADEASQSQGEEGGYQEDAQQDFQQAGNQYKDRPRASDKFWDKFKNKSENQIKARYYKEAFRRRENEQMYPGQNDPKLFIVNVHLKSEDDMVLRILNKAKHKAETSQRLNIVSAMSMKKKHPGKIFVEAFSEKDIRQALDGFNNVIMRAKLIQLEHLAYTNLFNEKTENKINFQEGEHINIGKGIYQNDLAKIIKIKKNSVDVVTIPRLNVKQITRRIRQQTSKMTDPKQIEETKVKLLSYLTEYKIKNKEPPKNVSLQDQDIRELRQICPQVDKFIKQASYNGLIILNYKFDQIRKHVGTYRVRELEPLSKDGSRNQYVQDKKKFTTVVNFKKGQQVQIIGGQLERHYGIIIQITQNTGVIRCLNKQVYGYELQEPLEHLAKKFKQNQKVKVVSGTDMGKTGVILQIEPKIVHIYTDNGNTIKINKKNLQMYHGETICEQNVHGLKKNDLIKTTKNNIVGIVLETRKDNIKILDTNNNVQVIGNMDFDSILSTKNVRAINRSGDEIESNSTVIIRQGIHEGKRSKVIHVYRQHVFLFNQSFDRTSGVSVQMADSLSLVSKKDTSYRKPFHNTSSNSFNQQGAGGGDEDVVVGKSITIKTGPLKGYQGVIKSVNKDKIQVRVPSKSTTVWVQRETVGQRTETMEIGKTPNRRGGPMTHIYAASPHH